MTHRYDALGRRIETRDGLGQKTTVTYDALSNPRLVVDPEGTFTETVYDPGSRPIATLRPEGIRIEQLFDDSDRPTGYRDALGNFTSYSYDALGRRTATVYPDTTTELSTFDATGNLIVVTDPGGTVQTLTYYLAGRLATRAITLGPGVVGPTAEAFEYDGLGRLTRAVSGIGAGTGPDAVVTERTYDSLSRLLGEIQNGRAVTFGYDEIGARTALTYPSGPSYQLAVDALGRPSSLTQLFPSSPAEPRAAFIYQGFRRQATTLGTSFTGTSSFDAAARLTEKSWVGGPEALAETLAWTPKSLIASITRTPIDLGNSAFSYDQAGRLLGAQRAKPPVAPATTPTVLQNDAFTYDTAENLLAHTEQTACEPSASTTAFPLDPSGRNRPSAAGADVLEWDPSGNLVRKGDQRFQYDYKNHLTVVTDLGGTEIARYSYDAFNRRVKKQVGAVVTETVWDDWEPIEEYKNGQLASRRLFGPQLGELVRLEQDLDGDGTLEQTYLPVFDVLGNLAELRRENGDLVERYEYSPFGERRVIADGADPCAWSATSAAANAFGFHGLLEDGETGLLYARNRFFDPEMGRFVSMDPLGYVDGPNAYAYGMNSPANYSDPMGLEVEEVGNATYDLRVWVPWFAAATRKTNRLVDPDFTLVGMSPSNRAALGIRPAMHALNLTSDAGSPFISVSMRAGGARTIQGKVAAWINIDQAVRDGAIFITERELQADVMALGQEQPRYREISRRWLAIQGDYEREALFKGWISPRSIDGRWARRLRVGARGLMVAGQVLTVYDLAKAAQASQEQGSARPLASEAVRQAGCWAGSIAGFKAGTWTGALLGIETGPGAVLTGLGGGIVGSVVGCFAADRVADEIYEN